MRTILLLCFAVISALISPAAEKGSAQNNPTNQFPVATQWLFDSVSTEQRDAIQSIFMLVCSSTGVKGTGFLLNTGFVVTNAHVVEGCTFTDLMGLGATGKNIYFSGMVTDPIRDIALLKTFMPLKGGFELSENDAPSVGSPVSTWGYPLAYSGPAPLLSVGYIAGYAAEQKEGKVVRHVVVNGAFNPGNSGGPLFLANDTKVIGIVVAKHHLFPPYVKRTIDVLAQTQSGLMYMAKDERGRDLRLSEAQIISQILEQFYKTTQVMIGEAISARELKDFIAEERSKLQ